MEHQKNTFSGFEEPKTPQGQVNNLEPEDLEAWYRKELYRAELEENALDQQHRRNVASFVVRGALVVFAALLAVGLAMGSFRAAEIWWAALAPIIGYLIRVLFERYRQTNSRSRNEHKKTQTPV